MTFIKLLRSPPPSFETPETSVRCPARAIRLRMHGLRGPEIVQLIHNVLTDFETEVRNGCLVTIKARKITCHRLPIGSSD
jgi:hypothetical protein